MNQINIAENIIKKLHDAGADECECRVTDNQVTELYYESGKISMMRTNINTGIAIKAIKDKKKSVVSLNATDSESIEKAITQVMQATYSATPDEANGISDQKIIKEHQAGIFEADKDAMYTNMDTFLKEVKQRYPKISFDSISAEHLLSDNIYLNSNGTQLSDKKGMYSFGAMFMAVEDNITSSFNSVETMFYDINKPFLTLPGTKQTLWETEQQIRTISLPEKTEMDVIIAPNCLEEILSSLEDNFLSDDVLINGTSLFKDKIGCPVAQDKVNLYCKPLDKDIVNGYVFTQDGYIAENMPLIEHGILKNFVLSRYGAKRTGLPRSQNYGGCYVMEPGDISLEKMIECTRNGVLLNRLSGGTPGVDGDISGVIKNSFLIQDGKISNALSETMLSANLVKMLTNIKQISAETLCDGSFKLPWVKFGGITISGKD